MIDIRARVLAQNDGFERLEHCRRSFPIWTGDRVEMTEMRNPRRSEALLVRLVNGLEIKCSPDQFFRTKKINVLGTKGVQAKDLTNHLVQLTDPVFEFDHIGLDCYRYLNKLDNEELGLLVGLTYSLSWDYSVLDIPTFKKKVIKEIHRLLQKCGASYFLEPYFKRTSRVRFVINDEEYLEEIKNWMPTKSSFPESFWRSKKFLSGFLRALYTFSQISNEMFVLRSAKGNTFLKDVQQALLLFGVNSVYSTGLKVSSLLIFKVNCYRMAYDIGVIDEQLLLQGVDFTKFLKYKDRRTIPVRFAKVQSVEKIEEESLVEISLPNFMANGIILQNYE